MSEELNAKVIEVALRNLRVLGCKYVVVLPNGDKLVEGDLKLEEKKPKVKYHKKHSFKDTGYLEIMDAMQPGDSYEFKCVGEYKPQDLQKSVAGRAGTLFGAGNYTTHATADGVELLRLG